MNLHEDKVRLIKDMIELLNKKMNGKISKEEFNNALESMSEIIKSVAVKKYSTCFHCEDSGMVLKRDDKQYLFAYRCRCYKGESYSSIITMVG